MLMGLFFVSSCEIVTSFLVLPFSKIFGALNPISGEKLRHLDMLIAIKH